MAEDYYLQNKQKTLPVTY